MTTNERKPCVSGCWHHRGGQFNHSPNCPNAAKAPEPVKHWDNTTVCFGSDCPNCEREREAKPAPEPQGVICGECEEPWPCEVATGKVSGDALVLRHHPCSGPPVSITAPEPQDVNDTCHANTQAGSPPPLKTRAPEPHKPAPEPPNGYPFDKRIEAHKHIGCQTCDEKHIAYFALKSENAALKGELDAANQHVFIARRMVASAEAERGALVVKLVRVQLGLDSMISERNDLRAKLAEGDKEADRLVKEARDVLDERNAAVNRLAEVEKDRDAAEGVLTMLEWSLPTYEEGGISLGPGCPACGGHKYGTGYAQHEPGGHRGGCGIAAILARRKEADRGEK